MFSYLFFCVCLFVGVYLFIFFSIQVYILWVKGSIISGQQTWSLLLPDSSYFQPSICKAKAMTS